MLKQEGLILLVTLLAIPIVTSFEFRCEDGTLFGSCNEKKEICVEAVKNL